MKRLLLALLAVTACAEETNGPDMRAAEPRTAYIVTTSGDPSPLAARLMADGIGTARIYHNVIQGLATYPITAGQAEALRHQRGVLSVESDGMVFADPTPADAALSWGIDRIDQRKLPLDGTYTAVSTGAGQRAYIVDTGIRYSHTEFGGRAVFGWDYSGGLGEDCRGHGTHVAGTVGGATYGVARGVTLVSVRVFGCSGGTPYSVVIAALDYIATQPIGVVNMSLGGGANTVTDQAVANLTGRGFSVVVSAGNSGADACAYTPARAPSAVTVGSTTRSDDISSFSNHGRCVDVYAPGSSIISAYYTGDAATATLSGTSMSAPHVTGVIARRMGQGMTARQAELNVTQTATPRIPRLSRGAKGTLLYADPTS
jgi:subtilisin family serine protease